MARYDIEKIYPPIPSAPEEDEGQTFRLKTIKEVEAFMQQEISERSRLSKKFDNCSSITSYVNYGLTATTIITGSGGIACLTTGIGAPIALALGGISLASTVTSGITHRLSKIYTVKAKKHHDILVVAQTVLDGIILKISRAIEDASVSHEEFQQIINAKQRYLAKKHELRSKSKKALKEIYQRERQELIEQGRQMGREEIAKKLVSNSDTPHATSSITVSLVFNFCTQHFACVDVNLHTIHNCNFPLYSLFSLCSLC